MATLADLVTAVYRPRETMRRVLAGSDRWAPQVVVLAFLCASVGDPDIRRLSTVLPGLGLSAIAVVLLGLVVSAALWLVVWFVVSWLATMAGRWLGGLAPAADVRAALAWGMVPVIWSVVYRIPFALIERRL